MIRRLLDWLRPDDVHGVRAHFRDYQKPDRFTGESLRKYRYRQIDAVWMRAEVYDHGKGGLP